MELLRQIKLKLTDRKMAARARIAEAIVSLKDEGLLITIAEVARRAKAHWATVKKNWDLMAVVHTLEEEGLENETNQDLLARSAGVINPGGGVTLVLSDNSELELAAADCLVEELRVELTQEPASVSTGSLSEFVSVSFPLLCERSNMVPEPAQSLLRLLPFVDFGPTSSISYVMTLDSS